VYQWLLLQNGYRVSKKGYFVFAKVNKQAGFAQAKLPFELLLESLEGDVSWVEPALHAARQALDGPAPEFSQECEYCQFIQASHGRA
jgi:hypothetical protein